MSRQVVLAALLAAGLALLPPLYLNHLWPTVQALVPVHWGGGAPNHFVGREVLWTVACSPMLAFAVLTFLPQVRDGESLFWSSYEQRRTRLVLVASLVLVGIDFVHRAAHDSRPARQSVARPAAGVPAH